MATEHRITPLLLWGLALILVVATGAWFLNNFERRTQEIDVGLSAAARENGFLAGELFLRRLGMEAESTAGWGLLRSLPPSEDMLVIKGLGSLHGERREQLHKWLLDGGRLLVAATEPWDWDKDASEQQGGFLDDFGVQLHKLEEEEAEGPVVVTVPITDEAEDEEWELALELDGRHLLVDARNEADGTISIGDADVLLQYQVGDGWLTVTSDMGPFTNAHIGERDHAMLLALLAESASGGKVWLLGDSDVPWIGALLWDKAPYALIAAGFLILALLWHLGGRLGPLLPSPRRGRRDLLAHLQALADFHWRHGRGSHLTQVSRERIEQAWLRRHSPLRGMEEAERAAWVGQRVGLSPAEVRSALYRTHADDRHLLEQTRLLQRLWSAPGRRHAKRLASN